MESSTVMWVIVAVVVVLVLVAAAVALYRRASEHRDVRHRERANQLREQASATQAGIRRRQAEADEVEARAREVRAEADRKHAEAKKLEAQAHEKKATLAEHVQLRDERLREADELDPDVDASAESSGEPGRDGARQDHDERAAGHRRAT